MFSYISGEITDYSDDGIILENNGVGFELHMSDIAVGRLKQGGNFVKLPVYLSVKDNEMLLYGFMSAEEKNMFLKLISVTGIGPRGAIGILSGIDLGSLSLAIISSDQKTLSKVKGIGKKTAERIILELRESVNGMFDNLDSGENSELVADKDFADVLSALRGLGFTQSEASEAVRKARPKAATAEELLSLALKNL